MRNVPSHVNEGTEAVDNLGGILSVILVGSFVLAINVIPLGDMRATAIGLLVIALVAGILFVIRQRRAPNPLYDLEDRRPAHVLGGGRRRDHRVRRADGRDVHRPAVHAGRARVRDDPGGACRPCSRARCMILVAPRSAVIVEARGSRLTLLAGYVFVLAGFLTMLFLWTETASFWVVVLAFCFVGVGIGLSGTPASRSLTGSVPVTRVGMASGTADLQRDLGGALFNSLFGALLAAGYAASITAILAAAGETSRSRRT